MNNDEDKTKTKQLQNRQPIKHQLRVKLAWLKPSVESTPPETKPSEFTLPIDTSKSPRGKRKRAAIFAAIAVLVVGVGVGGWVFFGQGKDSNTATNEDSSQQTRTTLKAAVVLVDGTAQVSNDAVSWQDLSGEETLSEGQFVRTDASSRVVLELDDGSSVRLNGGSQLELKSLAANDIKIVNVSGEVYTRVVPSDRTFQVVAAEVSYTAKGTAYKTVNTDEQKGVVVYQSAVSESEKNQEVAEGKQYYSIHPAPEKTKTITDVSVEELKADAFAKWNLELDKQNTEFKDKLGILSKIEEQAPAAQTSTAPTTTASASLVLSGSVADKDCSLHGKQVA